MNLISVTFKQKQRMKKTKNKVKMGPKWWRFAHG